MEKFLNIILSVLVLFTVFVGLIYTFVLSLVNFALCLPIISLKSVLYFLKTKNK